MFYLLYRAGMFNEIRHMRGAHNRQIYYWRKAEQILTIIHQRINPIANPSLYALRRVAGNVKNMLYSDFIINGLICGNPLRCFDRERTNICAALSMHH